MARIFLKFLLIAGSTAAASEALATDYTCPYGYTLGPPSSPSALPVCSRTVTVGGGNSNLGKLGTASVSNPSTVTYFAPPIQVSTPSVTTAPATVTSQSGTQNGATATNGGPSGITSQASQTTNSQSNSLLMAANEGLGNSSTRGVSSNSSGPTNGTTYTDPQQSNTDKVEKAVRERSVRASETCPVGSRHTRDGCRSTRSREQSERTIEVEMSESPIRKNVRTAFVRPKIVKRQIVLAPEVSVEPIVDSVLGPQYGVWGQAYGDFDFRSHVPVYNTSAFYSRATTTVGLLTGFDYTFRGLNHPGDGLVTGLIAGYSTAQVRFSQTDGAKTKTAIDGPSVSGYASYFLGPFSFDGLAKVEFLGLNQDVDAGRLQTTLKNYSLVGDVNYRLPFGPIWIEPTTGVRYTYSDYGRGAVYLGAENGDILRVQSGVRAGYTSIVNGVAITPVLTALLYSDVLIRGLVTYDAIAPLISRVDQGRIRGQFFGSVNFDYGNGVSTFIQGEGRVGENYYGFGGKVGVRYAW